MKERRRFSPPTVGGSSLLVIFAVLCLVVFSLLTLSTVQASDRLCTASNQSILDYYKADTQAEQILAELRSGNKPEGVTQSGDIYQYSCPISDKQALFVRVKVSGSDFSVMQWKSASTADWTPDTDIQVWDGDLPD